MVETSTDYDLPIDWDEWSKPKKSKWLIQERNRRQAARQGTYVDNEGGYD